ncbi:molecular chaperone HtpG [Hufsiella ginkgonis]|uniref:Chaperone protein HtpG n=1 Tax=Hufsiella ginkgonis TaxID=2695274 RepID=A0A7K1XWA1_9SPHI|nr:molecular chaperone HtpG [Hufsiella ginkgonis]MXV15251.1 molecular chaperone HtpG [Hufsiella ginkgonis]
MQEKGSISIHTENIFPIIKKFLYSDHEIFLRELVSNAVDATQKLKRLSSLGEFNGEQGDTKIRVSFSEADGTITISDRGIGMTADEIKKYINQIAFSGATEFVEKYKDKGDDKQIIGHFGLGFYSAFMVSSKVEIKSLSFKEGSEAVRWECDGSTEFEITSTEKEERGSEVILHIADDSKEFLDKARLEGILKKYCRFLPVEIEFEGEVINDPNPIWTKSPSELTDEDYKKFYQDLYPFSEEPLFWIHLNVDYPFNLTGVLYFPKLKNDFEFQRSKIQLYSRQVFITDEVKDVVPEFLMLLHGVIDSPDIPLNVSRSFLQSDSNVKKINTHITKKVADKLAELYNKDEKAFEEKWDDIGLFVKYGMISNDKFYDKAKDFCLYKNTDGEYFTLDKYKEHIQVNQQDKNETLVALYASDVKKQDSFIQSAKKKGYDVLELSHPLDSHFIQMLESKVEKFTLKRVDSDTAEKLIEKEHTLESTLTKEEEEALKEVFDKAVNNKDRRVSFEPMPADELPVTVTLPEFMRRMKDMQALGGGGMQFMGNMPEMLNVAVNANHPLAKKILAEGDESVKIDLAKQAYDLALLSQGMLTGSDLTNFIRRSVDITVG